METMTKEQLRVTTYVGCPGFWQGFAPSTGRIRNIIHETTMVGYNTVVSLMINFVALCNTVRLERCCYEEPALRLEQQTAPHSHAS